ncbi:hypothetical protein AB0D08_21350 [Kitasatospora sp. NPDC048540]|uniref:hypothetical protein n=1 Tax=unclassified Kitasatospora TaxID=2633591 RepID=UPI0011EA6A11|nr:hypothetical protein [Kitasatospora sp. MBT63]
MEIDYVGMYKIMDDLVTERRSLQLARDKLNSVTSVRENIEEDLWSAFGMPESGNDRITRQGSPEVLEAASVLGYMYESIDEVVDRVETALGMLEEATLEYENLKNIGRSMNVRTVWLEFILSGASSGGAGSFWGFLAMASSLIDPAVNNASSIYSMAAKAPNGGTFAESRARDIWNKLTGQKAEIERISARVEAVYLALRDWEEKNPKH